MDGSLELPQARKYSRFQKLIQYLRPHWIRVGIGVFTLLAVNGIGTYLPLAISQVIDELQTQFQLSQLWQEVGLIVGLATLMLLMRMVSRIAIFGVGRQVEFDLKQQIFDHVLRLEPAYFATRTIGDLINRATSDVDNIRRLVGFALLSFVNTLFAYMLTLPIMFGIDLELSLAAIAVYPFIFLLVNRFSKRLKAQQVAVQECLSRLSDLIQEDMSGISLIKIYSQEQNEQQAFVHLNQKLLDANLRLAKTRNILFPILGGIASLSLLVLIWFGGRAIASGAITVGGFVALILYVERLIFPTALLGFTITAYQRGEVSIDRIEAILTVQPAIDSEPDAIALPLANVKGELQARHLTFTYPGADRPALKDVSFTLEPGKTVAIVGPVGSGKSTLANAIPRLLDIQSGQLFLDGRDITQVQLRDLRAAIAYVPQDSFLFSTTIKNNIRYGKPNLEQFEIEQAAKQSQVHSEILNFPQTYKTLVGERGITLSGGQRQRTALARALVVDAPILILDDALASVDNQTATEILKNLTEGTQRKTVLFITHQLSAAAIADRIWVMDKGEIVQVGTHEDLLARAGLYQTLWKQYQLEKNLG
ncbi:ABC transporter ATP-binding protein [Altericista sp. CCNU0014]|uniref:ABC transporter ATP-binding protein n=1 Tax=Altericista sp. CCNU0014 TaxID=3082949 RepID=UPI00384B47A2